VRAECSSEQSDIRIHSNKANAKRRRSGVNRPGAQVLFGTDCHRGGDLFGKHFFHGVMGAGITVSTAHFDRFSSVILSNVRLRRFT